MESEGDPLCYICREKKKKTEDIKLKSFSEKTWTELSNAAILRKSDRFTDFTSETSGFTGSYETLQYHTVCYKNYTAVKGLAAS